MSTTPTDILENAEQLPETSESEIRTKISRLYYALFSHACEFEKKLPSQGSLLKRDSGAHAKLSQRLTNPSVKSDQIEGISRQLGTQQMMAHDLRVKADYRLDEKVDKSDLLKCKGYVKRGMAIKTDFNVAVLEAPPAPPTASLTRIK